MSQTDQAHTTPTASSAKMLRAMVSIGIMCALMIVLTFEGTLPRVERLKAAALERAIFKVLPGAVEKVTYQLGEDSKFKLSEGDEAGGPLVYAGYDDNGKLSGVVIEASGMGYADIIRILYGYDPISQTVVGFYVLESKETPGLGDKIEKDANFLTNFDALDVSLDEDLSNLKNVVIPVKNGTKANPWEVDGITGATISSRAIGNIIGTSSAYWVPLIFENQETFKNKTNEMTGNE